MPRWIIPFDDFPVGLDDELDEDDGGPAVDRVLGAEEEEGGKGLPLLR